jgi:hypothetical protein
LKNNSGEPVSETLLLYPWEKKEDLKNGTSFDRQGSVTNGGV